MCTDRVGGDEFAIAVRKPPRDRAGPCAQHPQRCAQHQPEAWGGRSSGPSLCYDFPRGSTRACTCDRADRDRRLLARARRARRGDRRRAPRRLDRRGRATRRRARRAGGAPGRWRPLRFVRSPDALLRRSMRRSSHRSAPLRRLHRVRHGGRARRRCAPKVPATCAVTTASMTAMATPRMAARPISAHRAPAARADWSARVVRSRARRAALPVAASCATRTGATATTPTTTAARSISRAMRCIAARAGRRAPPAAAARPSDAWDGPRP